MPDPIILSGFADEAASEKTIDQQFSTMAALGLTHFSIRFIDAGGGIKNVLELTDEEIRRVRQRMDDYGLRVSSIGSPVGKVKIADIDDGTTNRFVPFTEYLESEVAAALRAAEAFDTRLIRGFSFYHPKNSDFETYLPQAIDQLAAIAERCDQQGRTFGLEVEANLIGHRGEVLKRIYEAVNSPALVLVFDGGNLVTQGFTDQQILEQFRLMLPGLGWLHVKDYADPDHLPADGQYIDEDALNRYVPADRGSAGYEAIFRELRPALDELQSRISDRNLEGFFMDLEPHLRGGGQFGGYSGPDGMGIALRSLIRILDETGIEYRRRDLESLRRSLS